MKHKHLLLGGSLLAALAVATGAVAANTTGGQERGYCAIPYLYATNIRPACAQLGANGVKSLYIESRMFEQMLNRPHIADVFPDPDLGRTRP